jgi:subtilisin family serine protease
MLVKKGGSCMNARFHRRIWPVAGVAILLSALLFPAAGAAGSVDHLPAKGTQTVFVELTATPAADIQVSDPNRQVSSVKAEQNSFREAARKAGIKFSERFAYNKLFNGVSLTVPVADLPKLARLPGVQNLYTVTTLALPELHSSTEMIHAPEVVADGYDGTGVKVGVIDTGRSPIDVT